MFKLSVIQTIIQAIIAAILLTVFLFFVSGCSTSGIKIEESMADWKVVQEAFEQLTAQPVPDEGVQPDPPDDIRHQGDGSQVFYSKTASGNDGNLVVLFPNHVKWDNVAKIMMGTDKMYVREPGIIEDNELIDAYHYPNENRVHTRRGKPGSAFGGPVVYTVYYKDGSTEEFPVPDCSVNYKLKYDIPV